MVASVICTFFYFELPSCFFIPRPIENKVHTYIESDNFQYNTAGKWVDGTIVRPSDGPMFILIDWE